jgi:UDP-GlcNAc:undecaprenyl-phosphate GlcNAc-1-phosphate transferase
MFSLIFLAGLSFAICFLLTPLIRNSLLRAGILDRPDDPRKLHKQPIPRLGGVPILLSMLIALAIFAAAPLSGAEAFRMQLPTLGRLLPAVVLILLIGVCDDLFGLRPWQKLAGEVAAACWVYWCGIRIFDVFGLGAIQTHWFSLPVTVLWLVGCANAFNLIDGMDGLASGVGFFATCTMLVAALQRPGAVVLGLLTAPLAGALLAFLRFNFNPASMFLGDSGSLSIGFLLGLFGVIWYQKSITLLGMTAPLMALAFPILEAGISVARRFLRGDPIFGADRGHIHHRLLDLGLTPRRAVLLLYGVTSVFATISLLASVPEFRYGGLVVIVFCAVSWIGIQHLGYAEFSEARKIILSGTVRQLIASQSKVRAYRWALERAKSLDECWQLTEQAMRELGFDHVELVLPSGAHYAGWLHAPDSALTLGDCWTVRIPLDDRGASWMQLSRHLDRGEGYLMLHAVVETVREVLPQKVAAETKPVAQPADEASPAPAVAPSASASSAAS